VSTLPERNSAHGSSDLLAANLGAVVASAIVAVIVLSAICLVPMIWVFAIIRGFIKASNGGRRRRGLW